MVVYVQMLTSECVKHGKEQGCGARVSLCAVGSHCMWQPLGSYSVLQMHLLGFQFR
jgi:hypothetical protein